MTVQTVPDTDLKYYLIAFDADGEERALGAEIMTSQQVMNELANGNFTDVFIMSHGWMGDIPYAKFQYNRWIAAMAACKQDIQRMAESRPGFRPLLIALHWPSRPWGNEDFGAAPMAFDLTRPTALSDLVEDYGQPVVDTPRARDALQRILAIAGHNSDTLELSDELRQAYQVLHQEVSLGSDGLGSAPGSDGPPFDPDAITQDAIAATKNEVASFGAFANLGFDALLAPLRVLSFWKMKDRACRFGEGGAHKLLANLQRATLGYDVRFHLMGHSFGCIVVSGMLCGPSQGHNIIRPVSSLILVQGALSLWSYCSDITASPGRPGYFRRLIDEGNVIGPIVSTQSQHDLAVGRFYPLGARIRSQLAFGELPAYGGVGAWGIRGPGLDIVDIDMQLSVSHYDFKPKTVYNLDGSQYIHKMDGFTGAHSDIAHPEVAHAVWEAALPY